MPRETLPATEHTCSGLQIGNYLYHTCVYHDLGTFRYWRSHDDVTMLDRAGKVTFRIANSW